MPLSSTDQHSLHSEGSTAVLVRSTQHFFFNKMKFLVFFFLCFVALSAAAPQFITTWPGYVGDALGPRTIVAGPTVVNGFDGRYDGRFATPGFIRVY